MFTIQVIYPVGFISAKVNTNERSFVESSTISIPQCYKNLPTTSVVILTGWLCCH
ncbi:MAG: hypothetical protein ACTS6P_01615 [Candidatus Hodgkinia cicadicola]